MVIGNQRNASLAIDDETRAGILTLQGDAVQIEISDIVDPQIVGDLHVHFGLSEIRSTTNRRISPDMEKPRCRQGSVD